MFDPVELPSPELSVPEELRRLWGGGDELDPDVDVVDEDDPEAQPIKGRRGFNAKVISED